MEECLDNGSENLFLGSESLIQMNTFVEYVQTVMLGIFDQRVQERCFSSFYANHAYRVDILNLVPFNKLILKSSYTFTGLIAAPDQSHCISCMSDAIRQTGSDGCIDCNEILPFSVQKTPTLCGCKPGYFSRYVDLQQVCTACAPGTFTENINENTCIDVFCECAGSARGAYLL